MKSKQEEGLEKTLREFADIYKHIKLSNRNYHDAIVMEFICIAEQQPERIEMYWNKYLEYCRREEGKK